MARMPRLVVPGYPHHVTQRGNRRQQTFFCKDDYRHYIALLSESSGQTETEIWADFEGPRGNYGDSLPNSKIR